MVPTRRDVAPDAGERLWTDRFPATRLRKTAREMGCVRRVRTIDPVVCFWVFGLGFGAAAHRPWASLRRGDERVTAQTLVPSPLLVSLSGG